MPQLQDAPPSLHSSNAWILNLLPARLNCRRNAVANSPPRVNTARRCARPVFERCEPACNRSDSRIVTRRTAPCRDFPHKVTSYTFGSPRAGNARFGRAYSRAVPCTFRVLNALDIVPQLPPMPMFSHVGHECRIFSADVKLALPQKNAISVFGGDDVTAAVRLTPVATRFDLNLHHPAHSGSSPPPVGTTLARYKHLSPECCALWLGTFEHMQT